MYQLSDLRVAAQPRILVQFKCTSFPSTTRYPVKLSILPDIGGQWEHHENLSLCERRQSFTAGRPKRVLCEISIFFRVVGELLLVRRVSIGWQKV